MPPADVGAQPEVIHVAQSREAAELALRIQQLEEELGRRPKPFKPSPRPGLGFC